MSEIIEQIKSILLLLLTIFPKDDKMYDKLKKTILQLDTTLTADGGKKVIQIVITYIKGKSIMSYSAAIHYAYKKIIWIESKNKSTPIIDGAERIFTSPNITIEQLVSQISFITKKELKDLRFLLAVVLFVTPEVGNQIFVTFDSPMTYLREFEDYLKKYSQKMSKNVITNEECNHAMDYVGAMIKKYSYIYKYISKFGDTTTLTQQIKNMIKNYEKIKKAYSTFVTYCTSPKFFEESVMPEMKKRTEKYYESKKLNVETIHKKSFVPCKVAKRNNTPTLPTKEELKEMISSQNPNISLSHMNKSQLCALAGLDHEKFPVRSTLHKKK